MLALNKEEIQVELEKILNSKTFRKSTVQCQFLRFIVNQTLDNKINEIKEYSIAVYALGRPHDFNPQIDALIRIHASRLRRNLLEYYKEEGKDDPIEITLVKGTYIPEFKEKKLVNDLDSMQTTFPISTHLQMRRLAVIPFKNLNGLPANDILIDGFGEQLSSNLAQFQEIAVISYFSTSKFRKDKPDIREVGKELGANYLITGSIFYDLQHLKISIQLLNSISGEHIWTQSFDRRVQNDAYPYEIFEDIIHQIVPMLVDYHGIVNRKHVYNGPIDQLLSQDNTDAVSLYYYYQVRFNHASFQTIKARLEKAVYQNTGNALAWAILSQMYIDAQVFGFDTNKDNMQEAIRCTQQALLLDPDCQHAHITQAWIYLLLKDQVRALQSIDRFLSINSQSPFGLAAASLLMSILGEYEKSLHYYQQSQSLNPNCSWWINLGPIFSCIHKGDYEEAMKFAHQIQIPGTCWNDIFKIILLNHLSRSEEASILTHKVNMAFPGKLEKARSIFASLCCDSLVKERVIEGLHSSESPTRKRRNHADHITSDLKTIPLAVTFKN